MAMHLGRHMSTKHGGASAKRPGKSTGKARPQGIAHRFNVQTSPADELIALLQAAQKEAGRRLAGLRRAIR